MIVLIYGFISNKKHCFGRFWAYLYCLIDHHSINRSGTARVSALADKQQILKFKKKRLSACLHPLASGYAVSAVMAKGVYFPAHGIQPELAGLCTFKALAAYVFLILYVSDLHSLSHSEESEKRTLRTYIIAP